jgi:ribosome recycling factor
MDGRDQCLQADLASLRTGRASANLLDPIQVQAYGSPMPLTQVGTVTVPEPRMISVNVWDKALVSAVDRAIRESNLGFNPIVDGTNLRIPLPELNEQRRKELVKIAHQYAENAKIAARHVRRDGMEPEEGRKGRRYQPGRFAHPVRPRPEDDRRHDLADRRASERKGNRDHAVLIASPGGPASRKGSRV